MEKKEVIISRETIKKKLGQKKKVVPRTKSMSTRIRERKALVRLIVSERETGAGLE